MALLPIDEIQPSPLQPRQQFEEKSLTELAESLKRQGMLQPIVVREVEGGYEVVIGERRVRAARLAGLEAVLAVVRGNLEDTELLTLALVENIQREDLNPIEEARAYRDLLERTGQTQKKLGETIGKSQPAIANALRLLTLPPELQEAVADGRLPPAHARALLRIASLEEQKMLATAVIAGDLSLQDMERIAKKSARRAKAAQAKNPDMEVLQHRFEGALAAKVRLKYRGKRGKIEIHFQSFEELERIATLLIKRPHDKGEA